MARGTNTSDGKTYFKITYEGNDKDNGTPFFSEQKKDGDKWKAISQDTYLEGKLIGINKSTYEYKGKTQYVFEILIDGGDETYALQLNYGYFTRGILNSLASIKDFSNTEIRLEIYRNSSKYVTVGVKRNGERTDWFMDIHKLPKLTEEKWESSFEYLIDEIVKNIGEVSVVEKKEEPKKSTEEPSPIGEVDDDLPF